MVFTIVSFCFWKDTSEASAIFAFAFGGIGGLVPLIKVIEACNEVEGSLCILALKYFLLLIFYDFSQYLLKIAPDVTKWSQKVWALAKT